MTAVPLVDLGWQRDQVDEQVQAGFAQVLATTSFIDGPQVEQFERAFAAASGVRHAVGVGNGTDAIELALRALGLRPGSQVALPANTFVATAEAVLRAGLVPVLLDVDPEHLLLDPALLAGCARNLAAVLPVHLHGQLAPMAAVGAVAREHGLRVVEDAAQAQLARHSGRSAGGWGDLAATSFYPGKNLGAYGDGGAVLTDDDELAERVRGLGRHGTVPGGDRYDHPRLGFNSRLDTLQAVVLLAKLARLPAWNALRREAADRYAELLADCPAVRLPATAPGNEHTWHVYAVRVPERDRVLAELRAHEVGAAVHYPVPLHRQGVLAGCPGHGDRLPIAEAAAAETLSLPMFPGITPQQQERVVDVLRSALAGRPVAASAGQSAGASDPAPGTATARGPAGAYAHPRATVEGHVGPRTRVWANAHVLAGAVIGADGNVGEGAYVEAGARLGDRVTVKNGVQVWDGVTVEDDVFLGPGVLFTNDRGPRSRRPAPVVPTLVQRGASIGAGAVVVCGTRLGEACLVGAGAVVTRDVPAHALVVGNPARRIGWVCGCGQRLPADLTCAACGTAHERVGPDVRSVPTS